MTARDLLSKLAAAGLSAGVFLIWWPEHHPAADLASLVLRGALWTLTFELLLLAFAPLERAARRGLRAHMRPPELPALLAAVPDRTRLGGACVLACAGAALPVGLIAGAHAPVRPHRAARPIVIVRRPVVRERVIVREVVGSAAAEHPAPVSPVPAAVAAPAPRVRRAARRAVRRAKPIAVRRTRPAVTPAPKPSPPVAQPSPTPAAAEPAPAAPVAPAG